MSTAAALVACRFLHDVSAMLLFGAFAYLASLVPSKLALDTGRRLRAFQAVATGIAVATTLAALPLESAVIGEGWSNAYDRGTIASVLLETSVGHAWQAQAIAVILLAATLRLPVGRRQAATALAAGIVVACVSLTGHAVMHSGWLGVAHQINDAVHALAGGAWLGALLPLLPILAALGDVERRREAQAALRRFSTAGHAAVALVVLSGIGNSILVLGKWPSDWSVPYQALLAGKIGLVALMVALAIVNRYVFVRRIAGRPRGAVRAIAIGTIAEIVLGVVVIGLVATFGTLAPMPEE